VEDVMEGYCAQKAGIKARDIITNVGGHNITCMADLTLALRKFKAGDQVTVTVYRNGETIYLNTVLDAKPQETEESQTDQQDTIFSPEHEDYQDWYNYFAPYFGG
jgi:S1-C subfamily serine protease